MATAGGLVFFFWRRGWFENFSTKDDSIAATSGSNAISTPVRYLQPGDRLSRREEELRGSALHLTSDKENCTTKMDLGRVGAGGCRPAKGWSEESPAPERPNLLGNAQCG